MSTKRLKLYISSGKLVLLVQQGLFAKRILSKQLVILEDYQTSTTEIISRLKTVLIENNYNGMAIDIILSATHVKYMIVSGNARLTIDEQHALARHSFEATYGESVSDWNIFISCSGFNRNEYVCAVDKAFQDDLLKLMKQQDLKIVSLAPALTTVINNFRKTITPDAWFIFVEQNHMHLVKLSEGFPVTLRQVNLIIGWETEIEAIFARESLYLQENKLPVFFFWPEKPDFMCDLFKKHKMHILRVKPVKGFSANSDSACAVGLCA